MQFAYEQAALAAAQGEIPVGAIIVSNNQIIGQGFNSPISLNDPTAHAEIVAIREACQTIQNYRLPGDAVLYVTLEPCGMCAAAISFARLRRVYFGAYDVKGGGVEHGPRFFHQATCHHAPEIYGGLEERRAAELLKEFFRRRR